jgi:hypothetical protein
MQYRIMNYYMESRGLTLKKERKMAAQILVSASLSAESKAEIEKVPGLAASPTTSRSSSRSSAGRKARRHGRKGKKDGRQGRQVDRQPRESARQSGKDADQSPETYRRSLKPALHGHSCENHGLRNASAWRLCLSRSSFLERRAPSAPPHEPRGHEELRIIAALDGGGLDARA